MPDSEHPRPAPRSPPRGPLTAKPAAAQDIDAVTSAVLTASRLLVAVAVRSLAAVEDIVTLPQFRLLVVLHTQGPVKLVALAERLGVNPSTALRMAERLSAAGMISREPSPHNRREVSLDLTAAGRRIVDDVTAHRRVEIAAIVARMDPDQQANLVEALRAFTDAGGEPAADTQRDALPLGWA